MNGYQVRNIEWNDIGDSTGSPSAFPLEMIDIFIGLVRVASGAQTGYAQLLVEPENMIFNYDGIRGQVVGTSVRKYPESFENYYWNENSFQKLTNEQALHIGIYGLNLALCQSTIRIELHLRSGDSTKVSFVNRKRIPSSI